MNIRQTIIGEIEEAPESFLDRLLAFLRLLKEKDADEKLAPLLLSESSLAKDWAKPEEDEAWADL